MINIENLKPFPKFCYTIGMIPKSYKESLTYEEQLMWFCDFLQNTVIPTVNNNGQAVQELQSLFVELKNYVDNYFTNLDVQQEINNKLDQMTEDGTLQEIINTFIESNCSINFNTVNDMINSIILKDGSFAKTLGYYNINDGGSALYKIKNTHNENDEFIELNNGLFAILIPSHNTIYLKQFGAIGDNETDEHEILQRFFNYPSKNYIVNNGNYCTLTDINLKNSNCNISFENATLRFLPNASTNYYILNCYNLHDITFDNIHLIGDKNEHTGTTGQWGHCLNVTDCYNINIKNSIFENAWGDGIYLGLEFTKTPLNEVKNLTVDNCKILNCSRNGISVCTGKNITIKNSYIEGTNRIDPKAGIDIEPEHQNTDNAYLENLIIDNVIFNKNNYGISVVGTNHDITANISDCKVYNAFYGFALYNLLSNNKSVINVSNLICNGLNNSGIYLHDINSKSYVNISNPQIFNCTKPGTIGEVSQAGIYIDCSDTDSNNVTISNPIIYSDNVKFGSSLYIKGNQNTNLKKSRITNIISDFDIYVLKLDTTSSIEFDKTYHSNYYALNIGGDTSLYNKSLTTSVNDYNYVRKLSSSVPNNIYEFEYDRLNNYSYFVDLTLFQTIYDNGTVLTNKRFKGTSNSGILKVRVYNGIAYIIEKIGTWQNVQ